MILSPNSKSYIPYSTQRGFLLLELLVAISILAIILAVGSESVYVSLQSGKTSSESDVAIGLANETLEATRAISDEKWQNLYNLTKGSQYHVVQSSNKWATSSASELISLNTAKYTRYFTVLNVCRDTTPGSRLITGLTDTNGTTTSCTTSTGIFDPSTEKVTVTVTWSGSGSPVIVSDYFLRWKNAVCPQTSWAGGVGSGTKTCPDTTYVYKESPIAVTGGGALQIQ